MNSDRNLNTADVIFIVGAGRSGTTWLHMMLGAHPAISTGQESQLFHKYLRGMNKQWRRELAYPETEDLRKHGITSYITEDRFIELLRQFALAVFGNVHAEKPGANLFLEKSPNNSFNIDLIYSCFPDARFIHVIRDGRDVVTSMLAARKGWGRQWAPVHASDAATEWAEAVSESRRLADKTNRYIEVRYEDLLQGGAPELGRVFEFLGLDCNVGEVAEIYDRFSFEKLKKNEYRRDVFLSPGAAKASGTAGLAEPKGFFRKGVAGDWKNALSGKELAEVYWCAGDWLETLKYVDREAIPSEQPATMRRRQRLNGLKGKLKRLGKKLLG